MPGSRRDLKKTTNSLLHRRSRRLKNVTGRRRELAVFFFPAQAVYKPDKRRAQERAAFCKKSQHCHRKVTDRPGTGKIHEMQLLVFQQLQERTLLSLVKGHPLQ